jgi:hypothetical protein
MKLLLAGLVALGLSAALSSGTAQSRFNFSGAYTVSGTNPDGSKYVGAMNITAFGDGYRVIQTYADGSVYRGVGNDVGGPILAVSFLSDGQPSVAIYQINSNTTLEGYWQNYDSTVEGKETATLSRGSLSMGKINDNGRYDYSGNYNVQGTEPDGSRYTGSMTVSSFGDGYRVRFVSGQNIWRGIATDIDRYLAISYQSGSISTISIFERTDNGSSLRGYWQDYNNSKKGTEIATLGR